MSDNSKNSCGNDRKQLWIAMSDLWLDSELSEEWLRQIAEVVAGSGLDEDELDQVFKYELAPFLGGNHLITAGEWQGFDPQWVCEQAKVRQGKFRLMERLASFIGLTTYAARPEWRRVKQIALRK